MTADAPLLTWLVLETGDSDFGRRTDGNPATAADTAWTRSVPHVFHSTDELTKEIIAARVMAACTFRLPVAMVSSWVER